MAPAIEETKQQVAGHAVRVFELTNDAGLRARISELGASLLALHLPDRQGKFDDVVLGEHLPEQALQASSPFFGSTVGRVANRIQGAATNLEGRPLKLRANDPPHHLHGGPEGFDKQFWVGESALTDAGPTVTLRHESPDGFEGYPGTLKAEVSYALTADNRLCVTLSATCSASTFVNLAHHSYWNLDGESSGTIADHQLQLHASHYTPGEPVPTGKLQDVTGTPFDLRSQAPLGERLRAVGGFDHNFVVDGPPHTMRDVATLYAPRSGRQLTLRADQPGVQLYTGNSIDPGRPGKGGRHYPRHAGVCLETQAHPNSPNVSEWLSDVILRPGERYVHRMDHRFTVVG